VNPQSTLVEYPYYKVPDLVMPSASPRLLLPARTAVESPLLSLESPSL
jgi:hypothetical protein